jgi:hypothetical protein
MQPQPAVLINTKIVKRTKAKRTVANAAGVGVASQCMVWLRWPCWVLSRARKAEFNREALQNVVVGCSR